MKGSVVYDIAYRRNAKVQFAFIIGVFKETFTQADDSNLVFGNGSLTRDGDLVSSNRAFLIRKTFEGV